MKLSPDTMWLIYRRSLLASAKGEYDAVKRLFNAGLRGGHLVLTNADMEWMQRVAAARAVSGEPMPEGERRGEDQHHLRADDRV